MKDPFAAVWSKFASYTAPKDTAATPTTVKDSKNTPQPSAVLPSAAIHEDFSFGTLEAGALDRLTAL